MISKEEYIEFAENGFNIVPLIKAIEKDLDSPINCLLYTSPSPRDQ